MSAGADVFRLNMSHAKHDWVREIVPRIRQIAAEIPTAGGDSARYAGAGDSDRRAEVEPELKPGDILEFTVRGAKSEEKYSVDVNYDGLVNDISVGDIVLVDNGVMRLLVLEKEAQPDSLQSAYAGRARFAPAHQSARRAREPAAADAEGSRRCRARRRS